MTGASWLVVCCLCAAVTAVVWPGRARSVRRRLTALGLAVQSRPAVRSHSAVRSHPAVQSRWWSVLHHRPDWRRPRPWRLLLAGAGLLGCAAAAVAGPVAGLTVAVYGGVAVHLARRGRAARASARSRVRALDALCALAADLRAGAPPGSATPPTLAGGDGQLDRLVQVLRQLADQTGAPLAELLDRVAAHARATDRIRAVAAAQAAGAQATAWLLAALPAGGIALGYAIGADPLPVLLHTPLGASCLLGAVVLQIAGMAWADRLIAGPRFRPDGAFAGC